MSFGATTVGYAIHIDLGRLRYIFGLGYGVSYASLDSKKFGMKKDSNTGYALVDGIELSLFPFASLAGLGIYLQFKVSPDLPAVYAKDQTTNRRYFENTLDSSLGLTFRF